MGPFSNFGSFSTLFGAPSVGGAASAAYMPQQGALGGPQPTGAIPGLPGVPYQAAGALGGSMGAPAAPQGGGGFLDTLHNGVVNNGDMIMGMASGLLGAGSLREGLARGMPAAYQGQQQDQFRNTLGTALKADSRLTDAQRNVLMGNQALGLQYLSQALKPKEPRVADVNGNLVDYTDQNNVKTLFSAPKTQANDMLLNYQTRKAMADEQGLKPDDPAYKSFMLTGKMPKEDQQDLTPTDKKAMWSAEDEIPVIDNTISSLQRARELNKKTYTGYTAGLRGSLGTSMPGGSLIFNSDTAKATSEFNKIMSMEAIKSMAATLKGATTDSELERFVDILGDPSTDPDIREKTIDRMLALSQRVRQVKQGRVDEIRGQRQPLQGVAPGQPSPQGAPGQPPANTPDPFGIR